MVVAMALTTGVSQAQEAGATATASAAPRADAYGTVTFESHGSNNYFEAAEQRKTQTIHTTPHVYAPPSMFGGANNCGMSDSLSVGVTGFGIGGSKSSESNACNAREDTSISYKLGFPDVAKLRFFCFGEAENRMAYEAAGYLCPSSGTAKGITGAPVGQKFFVAQYVPETLHMRVNQDGTVTTHPVSR